MVTISKQEVDLRNNHPKRNGFTLIELLAVIVILAVIALIAIPQVLKILEKAKKSSFVDSVYGISSIIDNYMSAFILQNDGNIPDETLEFKCNKNGCNLLNDLENYNINGLTSLNFKGKKMVAGSIKASDSGRKIYINFLSDGKYCANGYIDDLIISDDCIKLDTTDPILDENKLKLSSTTNSVTTIVENGFAEDAESGIKQIEIGIYDNDELIEKRILGDKIEYEFKNLLSSKSYQIKVEVTNNNGLISKIEKTVTTKSIGTVKGGIAAPVGYAQSKTVLITFTGNGAYLIRPSVNVRTNIPAVACSNSIDAEYDCEGEIIEENEILNEKKWYKVTSNPILIFESNGSISYKVTDGVNVTQIGSTTVSGVDRTAPTESTFIEEHTTNSITVTASGKDDESGITRYQFSKDGGTTWEPSTPQELNKYTFNALISGTYSIKSRVINGTYVNNGQNSLNTKESNATLVTTGTLGTVSGGLATPVGYAQSKTVLITFTGNGTYLIKPSVNVKTNVVAVTCTSSSDAEYSCNGAVIDINGTLMANTWYKITSNPTLTFESNGSVSYKVTDGVNVTQIGSTTVSGVDRTAPTESTFIEEHTTNSITVTASGKDDESGITRYQFSKDGGTTWEPSTPQELNKYTFNALISGTYSIKSRVINGTYVNNGQNSLNTKESNATLVTTGTLGTVSGGLATPVGYAQSKTVLITFTGNGTYLIKPSVNVKTNVVAVTCTSSSDAEYSCNGAVIDINGTLMANTWYKITSNPTLTFESNGSVSYKVTDGVNVTQIGSTTVSGVDRTAPQITVTYKKADGTAYTSDTWTNQSIIANITATDNGEIDRYQVTYDGANYYDVTTNTYTISNETRTDIWFRAIDKAGNVSSLSDTYIISIDKTPPTINYNYEALGLTNDYSGSYNMGYFNSAISPILTLSDNLSGIDDTAAQIVTWKDGTWLNNAVNLGNYQYRLDMTAGDGLYIPHIIVYDKAGNVTVGTRPTVDLNHLTVWKIDTTPPIVNYNLLGGTYTTNQTVQVTASDSNFRYMNVHVYKDNVFQSAKSVNGTANSSHSVLLDSPGIWTVYTYAVDNAGNKQIQNPDNGGGWYYQNYTITYDRTITFNANGGSVNPASKTVTYGSTYGSLPTPTKTDAKFQGWFTEDGTMVTSSTPVTIIENQTLYAHWLNKYTLKNLVENNGYEDSLNAWIINSPRGSANITIGYTGVKALSFVGSSNGTYIITQQNFVYGAPTVNHKYYGSMMWNGSGVEMQDARFEIWSQDAADGFIVFFHKDNITKWHKLSGIGSISGSTYTSNQWIVRNFIVSSGNSGGIADNLMIIDLTAAFGEGNEPSKEWCDQNIPYFQDYTTVYK